MITFNDVKEHINLYKEHYLNILTNYKKENTYLLKNINVDMTRWIYQYFIEISKINIECENKIENIQDVIIPDDIFQGLSSGIWYIENNDYVYLLKKSKYRESEFWYGMDSTSLPYIEKKYKDNNWENTIKNQYLSKFYEKNLKIKKLIKNSDSNYIQLITKLFKEKFITDYNNKFTNVFPQIVEKSKNYYVFENVFETNENIKLTKNILIKYKNDLIYILDDFFISNKKNNFFYSCCIKMSCSSHSKNIINKISSPPLHIYIPNENKLKLDYIHYGNILLTQQQFIAFMFKDEIIIYTKENTIDIAKQSILNAYPDVYKNIKFINLLDI